jgi:hypothetical protein
MKKLVIPVILLLGLAFVGFKTLSDHSQATVDSEEGLLLFVKSKPTQEHDFLGTVQTGAVVPNYKFETILEILIKRAKKEYPDGQGLIVRGYEADVIKFKD